MIGLKSVFVVSSVLLVGACASIVEGTSQDVEVQTNPSGADCTILREGKLIGRINPTPGKINISKSGEALSIVCIKENYADAKTASRSDMEEWVLGNLIIGGLIGVGIDFATGAANQYPSPILITLVPQSAAPQTDQAPTTNTTPSSTLEKEQTGTKPTS